MKTSRAINIDDLRELARRRLPRVAFGYLDGGAEDETTLEWNRAAFRRWAFVPRALPGTGSTDLSVELFGQRLALPLIVGPTGLNGLFWRRADVLLARAAAEAGVAFALSTASNSSLEDVAAAGPEVKWFQLIVDAAGDRLVVIVDGGVRRGADVVKALALGARAVLLGRAPLYGLAAAGQPGVTRALAILREELERVMFLLGCPRVAALSRAYLRER